MSEVSRSPYKKAILFEQLQNVQSNVFHAVDPFVAHLASPITAEKPVQTHKIFWAIGLFWRYITAFFILQSIFQHPPWS